MSEETKEKTVSGATAILGKKIGMTQVLDAAGNFVPVSVISIVAETFKAGDLVSVSGISIGKGFAGTVKRFHHGRGPMSHGSKSHRIPGSIGSGTTPGRVFKGRGMPGRMGGVKVTVRKLRVVSVDAEKKLLLVNGSVPGKAGNSVVVKKERMKNA